MKPISKRIATLIDRRNGEKLGNAREALENKVADNEAEEKRNKLMEQFSQYNDNPENINVANMWKILKKTLAQVRIYSSNSEKKPSGETNIGGQRIKTFDVEGIHTKVEKSSLTTRFEAYKYQKRSNISVENEDCTKETKFRMDDEKFR